MLITNSTCTWICCGLVARTTSRTQQAAQHVQRTVQRIHDKSKSVWLELHHRRIMLLSEKNSAIFDHLQTIQSLGCRRSTELTDWPPVQINYINDV